MKVHPYQLFIAERLKHFMREKRCKQGALAFAVRAESQSQVSKWCQGAVRIPAHKLALAAKELNVPIELFFPEEVRSPADETAREIAHLWVEGRLPELLRFVAERMERETLSAKK